MNLDSPRARSFMVLGAAGLVIALIVTLLVLFLRSTDEAEPVSKAYEITDTDRQALTESAQTLVETAGNYGVTPGTLSEDNWTSKVGILAELSTLDEPSPPFMPRRAAFEAFPSGFFADSSPFIAMGNTEYPSHYVAYEARNVTAGDPTINVPSEGYLVGENAEVRVEVFFPSNQTALVPTLAGPDWDGSVQVLERDVSESLDLTFKLQQGKWRLDSISNPVSSESLALTALNEPIDPGVYSLKETWKTRPNSIPDDHSEDNTTPFYTYE